MRIGIDLDNTIINYDGAFADAARERGLVPSDFSGSKQQLRDQLRTLPDGETEWQKLQGFVYGKGINKAALFSGVKEFISAASAAGHEIFIVSHKTEFGHYDADKVNLRDAATHFLKSQGLQHIPISFHATRKEKVDHIATLELDWFIDDLVEVYAEPHFPKTIKKILFHTVETNAPEGEWKVCRDWNNMIAHLLLAPLAIKLTRGTNAEVVQAASGGNSRVYKVVAEGKNYALKQYPSDERDRLNTERRALEWMAQNKIASVPQWIAAEPPYALMSWVEGSVVTDPSEKDIDEAAAFLVTLHRISHNTAADAMPLASEACLSGQNIIDQLEKRMAALMPHAQHNPVLQQFLQERFLPIYTKRFVAAKIAPGFATELPQSQRTLIAADFGFHNIMRKPDGTLAFIDFEYFGWDDPVKLMCDFLLHPATPLPAALRQHFYVRMIAAYGEVIAPRFAAFYPLFGLRWTLILLNEFIPERWQARRSARGEANWEEVKTTQLAKAEAMLKLSEKF